MGKNRTASAMDFGVRVAAVVEREGSLLLVRHQKPGRDPYWVLPGGELAEETHLAAGFSGVLYVSEFHKEGRHTIDVVVRMALEGDGEATLGSDPEVAPGTGPTLAEVRWVSIEELREIELLPTSIKERLLRDASEGWSPENVYVESTDG